MANFQELTRRRFLGQGITALGGMAALPMVASAQETEAASMSDLGDSKSPDDEVFWSKVRTQFQIGSDPVYLNTGSLGLLPAQIAKAVARYYKLYTTQGQEAQFNTEEQQAAVRQRLARFVAADAEEIAFTRNATEALAAVIDGIKMAPGDEVLTTTHEYPAVIRRWKRREQRFDIKIQTVDIPSPPDSPEQVVDLFRKAITP